MPVFDTIIWEEPPMLRGQNRPDLTHLADQVRAQPGKPALIAEFSTGMASKSRDATHLRNAITNRKQGFSHSDGTFTATTRTIRHNDGSLSIRVYATFVSHANR